MVRAHPAIDILVNNLGIVEPKPFEDIPDDNWRRFFEVHVTPANRFWFSTASIQTATRSVSPCRTSSRSATPSITTPTAAAASAPACANFTRHQFAGMTLAIKANKPPAPIRMSVDRRRRENRVRRCLTRTRRAFTMHPFRE
jgi:NAD(P)-dependent dehydrogenase (short-subunit alcohol dehydrogenase family)